METTMKKLLLGIHTVAVTLALMSTPAFATTTAAPPPAKAEAPPPPPPPPPPPKDVPCVNCCMVCGK
jgi:outer membrane biosynthesis protein TonB